VVVANVLPVSPAPPAPPVFLQHSCITQKGEAHPALVPAEQCHPTYTPFARYNTRRTARAFGNAEKHQSTKAQQTTAYQQHRNFQKFHKLRKLPHNPPRKGGVQMANFVNATAVLRIFSEQNRSICSISGVNPNVSASVAAGFVAGIRTMYNRGPVRARIHIVSDIEL